MNNKSLRSSMLLFLTAFIWGTAFVAQSVGLDYVGAFTFNAARNFIATIVLLPCIKLLDHVNSSGSSAGGAKQLGEDAARLDSTGGSHSGADHATGHAGEHGDSKTLIFAGIVCGICLAVASAFQQIGIAYTTVGKAGFLTAMYILIVPILGLFFKKKVRPVIWFCVGLAVVGMYLLCITEDFTLGLGDILEIACAFVFSCHILLVDHFSPKVDGVRMSCIQFLTCGIVSAIPALIFESPNLSAMLSAWVPILYAGVLSSAVGYTLQIIAQKNVDPVIASLIMSLESTFSLLAGWVLLHQYLSTKELIGCGLMFVAIIMAQLPGKKQVKAIS